MIKSHDISVSVQTAYIAEQSIPEVGRFVFAYTITIENTGSVAATLMTRHWIITDGNGKVQEVRGSGVVGKQPHLAPSESFRYTSAAMIETPVGSMQGSYQMFSNDGVSFDAPIPTFRLSVSRELH